MSPTTAPAHASNHGARAVLLSVVFLAAFCGRQEPRRTSTRPEGDTRRWLERSGFRLEELTRGSNSKGITGLAAALSTARIVLLGESCHGAHEFFVVRDRLVRELIEHHGFSAVLLEGSAGDAVALDEYVAGGNGNPHDLIAALGFWTWHTEEFAGTIEWLRAYNRARPGNTVLVAGIDSQLPRTSARRLLTALPTIAPELARRYRASLEVLAGQRPLPPAAQGAGEGPFARTVHAEMLALTRALRRQSPQLQIQARVLEQFMRIRIAPQQQQEEIRDQVMAENIRFLMDQRPSAKLIVLAHNLHISQRRPRIGWRLQNGGTDVMTVGMTFGDGSINAMAERPEPRVVPHPVSAAPPASLEGRLAEAGAAAFAVPTNGAGTPPYTKELLFMRSIGARYRGGEAIPVTLASDFDYVVYFRHVSPSRLLAR